ncbi:hypothetical protein Plhal304r1_c051g0134961 [Plasmopara halstedii]
MNGISLGYIFVGAKEKLVNADSQHNLTHTPKHYSQVLRVDVNFSLRALLVSGTKAT